MRNKKGQFKKGGIPWNKGGKFPKFSGKNHPLFGKPRSESTKRKLRFANIGKKKSLKERQAISKRTKGSKNPNWKGGRVKTSDGYILLYQPSHPYCTRQGYVPEHRIAVEKMIGRFLKPKEQVHHLGARDCNKPCMLMAFVNSKAHRRFERGLLVPLKDIIWNKERRY